MKLKFYSYKINFSKKIHLKRGDLSFREGIIIENNDTFAEIAPLPYFSMDSLNQVYKFLEANYLNIPNIWDATFAQNLITLKLPSLNFSYYALTHPLTASKRIIPYNFILGTTQEIVQELNGKEGIFKIKVGIYNFDEEINMLRKIYSQSKVKLIIDANCNLTIDQAQEILRETANNIVYFEDPCPTIKQCLSLNTQIALDELNRNNLINELNPLNDVTLNSKLKKCIKIIKPTISGMNEVILANSPILTSAFESPIAIKYIEQLSYTHNLPNPGTDTLKYFNVDEINMNNFIKNLKPIHF